MTASEPVPCVAPEKQEISLIRLLAIFLKIGSIGFGGGMAIIALMERELVRRRKLLSLDEFLHGVGFGQILGSFAVNVALFVGYRLFGLVGGLLSAVAFLFPSIVLVIALSALYFHFQAIPALQNTVTGLSPVVIALIVEAGWSIGSRVLRSRAAVVVAAGALIAGLLKMNALWILLLAGGAGALISTRNSDRTGQPESEPVASRLAAFLPALSFGSMLGTIGTTFFKIGLVFFGGGFLLVPVLYHRLVIELHWLTGREFVDGVAISNLTPGPIAVLATFAGYRLAGTQGALVATAALMAPAAALMLFITRQYERFKDERWVQRLLSGLSPAITGLILSTAIVLGRGVLASWKMWLFAAVTLLVLRKYHWPPVVLLALGATCGYFRLLS